MRFAGSYLEKQCEDFRIQALASVSQLACCLIVKHTYARSHTHYNNTFLSIMVCFIKNV